MAKVKPGQIWKYTWEDDDVVGLERESYYFVMEVINRGFSDNDTMVLMRDVEDMDSKVNEYSDILESDNVNQLGNPSYGWSLYADCKEEKNG